VNGMRAGSRPGALRSMLIALTAIAAVCALSFPPAMLADLRLTANTLLVMGGNRNPNGLTPRMQDQLGGDPWYPAHINNPLYPVGVRGAGYIDAQNNPNSPYAGWDFTLVDWPAEISLPVFGWKTFAESQRLGQSALEDAITAVIPTLGSDERVVAFGYSSSANVAVRVMRALQQQGVPAGGQLSFTLLGGPNRPNGGILQRFAGLHIPILDIDFDGTTPLDTPYQTVDISWEYDPASDFPTYPLNLLSVLNSLIGGSMLHGNYYRADINGERAFPDTTVGNITYVTLEPPNLPLLLPLYALGVPAPLLDLVEPALTVMVDWGYDRTVGPGVPTRAQLLPRIDPTTAVADLAEAISQGVRDAVDGLTTAAPAAPTEAVSPAIDRPSARTVRAAKTTLGIESPRTAQPERNGPERSGPERDGKVPRTPTAAAHDSDSVDRKAHRDERDRRADRDRR